MFTRVLLIAVVSLGLSTGCEKTNHENIDKWTRTSKGPGKLEKAVRDEGLDPDATPALVEAAFRHGAVQPTGTAITKILPPVSRFAKAGGHSAKKRTVLQQLGEFFDRFFVLS